MIDELTVRDDAAVPVYSSRDFVQYDTNNSIARSVCVRYDKKIEMGTRCGRNGNDLQKCVKTHATHDEAGCD